MPNAYKSTATGLSWLVSSGDLNSRISLTNNYAGGLKQLITIQAYKSISCIYLEDYSKIITFKCAEHVLRKWF